MIVRGIKQGIGYGSIASCLAAVLLGCQSVPRGTTAADLREAELNVPEPTTEQVLQTLSAPEQANSWSVVPVGAASRFSFAVDPASVKVAPGTVVRYSLASSSDLGVMAYSYEALRCATRERRIYAVAWANSGWRAASDPQWRRLVDYPSSEAQRTLYAEVFCDGKSVAGDEDDLRVRLERVSHTSRVQEGG